MSITARYHFAIVVTFLITPFVATAQVDEADALLTIDRIYRSGDFGGQGFSARWVADPAGYIRTESAKDGGRDIVWQQPLSKDKRTLVKAGNLIPAGKSKPLAINNYSWTDDFSRWLIYTNSQRVWRQNTRGDYWVYDRETQSLQQLGGTSEPASLMFAKFSPDKKHVAYVHDRNVYVENLQDHTISQVTETDSKNIINGTFDWVYEEELSLRDGFRWSPDGKKIAYWQIDTTGVPQFTLINNTDELYPRIQRFAYPKVGQRNSSSRIGIVDISNGETKWLEVPGDPRNHYLARMEWAGNSDELVIQQLNRLQNTNRVLLANVNTGELTTILTEVDDAWVDVHDEMHWIDDGARFTWISEKDGWRHVYVVSRSGDEVKLITPGEFDVIQLSHVDETNGVIYFMASPDNPAQRYLWRAALDGSKVERVTPDEETGTHSYNISPDGRWAFHSSSSIDTPSSTQLISLPDHDSVEVLAANKKLRDRIGKLSRKPTEFFYIDIEDDVSLHAWCIKPPDFDPNQKYPLFVYVYGEPAGQTVVDRWGGSSYLWHLMLAQRGYVVMSIDNRGTKAPRGRQWRKGIYRQVGILAPQDQAAAVRKLLAERPYLDPDRVGIWGWSGGGSMTLNAMFKFPDLYHTGISIAPVPNQLYYDTIYQERYMGLPDDNADGFRDGSPINFAEQLKGNLLLVHGTGDDNCHYQTMELLINELIRHNKPFQMMAYPNRSHSIREGANTSRHLRELMTAFLLKNLPPGGRSITK